MTWHRSSDGASALVALGGQFITVRSILWGASLSAIAVFLALNIGVRVRMEVVVASLCVALLGSASTIGRTWISTQKWAVLLAFPIRESTLIRQTVLVATGVLGLDVVCPVILFAALSADDPGIWEICCAALFGFGAAVLSVIALSATNIRARLGSLGALLVAAPLGIAHVGIGAAFAVAAAAVSLATIRELGTAPQTRRRAAAGSGLLLGELRSSTMALANTIGLVVMSAVFTVTMAGQGFVSPLGMAIVTANTPLNSYFSRYPSTYAVVMAAPRSDVVFARYYLGVCLFYAMSGAPAGVVLARGGAGALVAVSELAACATAAALAAWAMERFRPVTTWKSEREVLRHPRKYLPPAAGLAAATLVMLATSPA